ncbi:MAG: branched-chain amino acid ABC transporter permease [Deltaproteobacteria bacterium]|nr:branched-chain amino acid ABC transporter permease [Deltaproteobacteria bacterium]
MKAGKYIPVALLALVLIGIQQLTQMTGTVYYLTQMTMTAYYALLVIGLCLVMGYAGQISLGHAGFFAIGGYTSAVLTTYNLTPLLEKGNVLISFMQASGVLVTRQSLYGQTLLSVHPWPACIVALILATAIAFLIGIPVLKLKGHYLAMATLGFGIIIYRVALASEIFGQADGISAVPGFVLLPDLIVSGDFNNRVQNYYIACSTLIIGFLLLQNLIDSRVGRALRAIHGSEEAANAMGVNTTRYKLYTFVLSAVFAALAGILLTHYNGGIGPSEAGIMKSVRYVAIVAIGGMANLWGALTMAAILNFLSLRGMFGSYDDAVFGSILIIIMLFAPNGLLRLPIWQFFKKSPAGK